MIQYAIYVQANSIAVHRLADNRLKQMVRAENRLSTERAGLTFKTAAGATRNT
jgi:hypothetical protein